MLSVNKQTRQAQNGNQPFSLRQVRRIRRLWSSFLAENPELSMLHFLRLGDGQNIALHVPPAVRWFVCCCFVVCFVSLLLFFLCFALLLFVVVVFCLFLIFFWSFDLFSYTLSMTKAAHCLRCESFASWSLSAFFVARVKCIIFFNCCPLNHEGRWGREPRTAPPLSHSSWRLSEVHLLTRVYVLCDIDEMPDWNLVEYSNPFSLVIPALVEAHNKHQS